MTDLQRDQIEEYVVSHLGQALAEGWIQPYFQPIIRTITGNLAATEALARWVDPSYGCLMPAVFVPALEKHGLICMLDCFMVREVLKTQTAPGCRPARRADYGESLPSGF